MLDNIYNLHTTAVRMPAALASSGGYTLAGGALHTDSRQVDGQVSHCLVQFGQRVVQR